MAPDFFNLYGLAMNLKTVFPFLLPLAMQWARREAAKIQLLGASLTPRERRLAKSVGVVFPERVKLLLVPEIPKPDNRLLRLAARQTELLSLNHSGMALGHSIYICENKMSARLLSHELRHVYQCERHGGLDAFIAAYLQQVVEYGYRECPLEVDARHYERVAYLNGLAKNDDRYCIDS